MEEIVIDYDEKSDVCYINFHKPPLNADNAKTEGDFIFRFQNFKVVGVTILNFSKYEKIIRLLLSQFCTKGEIKK